MQAIVGHSFNQSSSGQFCSAYIRRADWPDGREVRWERLVERSDTRTKKWTIQRRVPASQESGIGFRHWRIPAFDESDLPRVRQRVRHPTNLARIWNSTSDATVTQIRTQILSGDDTAFSGLSHHPAVSCNVDPGGRPVTGPSLTLSQEKESGALTYPGTFDRRSSRCGERLELATGE